MLGTYNTQREELKMKSESNENLNQENSKLTTSTKFYYVICFLIGGGLAYFSAKTDVEMLKSPDQKSVLESVFSFEYADKLKE